ncbi:hypothetical protein FRX31_011685 [Thalictrum thalictroides]|uniref:Uncharacterized protein n=1 Tax=Thalictrum thalictroides TaxID=46969 RepID=A0A7J6WMX4_THATH|nr:hypothetical protein FRX31_011685 [Thalictrum thalictroides]
MVDRVLDLEEKEIQFRAKKFRPPFDLCFTFHDFGTYSKPTKTNKFGCSLVLLWNSHGKPLKVLFKEGLLLHHHIGNDGIRDVCKIDAEMEEIETEIGRLSLKLESLRLEKKKMNGKQVERIDQK